MSTGEIIAAVVSTVIVGAAGVMLFIGKQREARRDQELRSMLQPRGKLDLESSRTVRKKGLFGIGGRREDEPPAVEDEVEDDATRV